MASRKGDKLRAYNQIKQLARNNEIVLCALNVDGNADKQKAFSMLQPYCVSVNFIDITKVSVLFNIIIAFLPVNRCSVVSISAAMQKEKYIP